MNQSNTFQLNANEGWHYFLAVKPGTGLTIYPSGTWHWDPNQPAVGPGGTGQTNPDMPAPNAYQGCLLVGFCRVPLSPDHVNAPQGYEAFSSNNQVLGIRPDQVTQECYVGFQINDDRLDDNLGQLDIRVDGDYQIGVPPLGSF